MKVPTQGVAVRQHMSVSSYEDSDFQKKLLK
ncbi:hypothetical protein HmCmsJML116_03904 [Escherichia coli]|nr:hypothetical protein HmCmsJML116_03904 [Escherichia coli]